MKSNNSNRQFSYSADRATITKLPVMMGLILFLTARINPILVRFYNTCDYGDALSQ